MSPIGDKLIEAWRKFNPYAQGLVVLLSSVLIAGCLSLPPRPPDLNSVPIGPSPENYESQIREYFKGSLRDPYSAVYEIRAPVRGWDSDNDGNVKVFWAACGTVNAKNGFGGYVGQRSFLSIFNHQGRIIFGLIGESSAVPNRCTAWYAAQDPR